MTDEAEEEAEGWVHYPAWVRNFEVRLKRWLELRLKRLAQEIIDAVHPQPTTRPATGLIIRIQGESVATVTLSVDVANEVVKADWVDDKGDVTTAPNGPDGNAASISYSSSDPSVASVDSSGALTFSAAGNATITASAVDDTGAALAGFSDGSVDLVLTPGTAVGLEVSVDGAPPVPAPGT